MKRFALTTYRPKLSENDVERACLDLLRVRGYYPIRLQSGRFKTVDDRWITIGEKGIPDYILAHRIYPAFLLETKRPKGERSEEQRKKHFELTVAYRLAVATVDRVEILGPWLNEHEAKAQRAWSEHR